MQLARHVHEAAKVARQQQVGAGGDDGVSLFADDGVGDGGIFDAEGSAKAAACLLAGKRGQGKALDLGEQAARLRLHPQFAQARAAVMIGGGRVEADAIGFPAQHLVQIGHDLEGFRGHRLRPGEPVRIAFEQFGIMAADGAGAGARGDDDGRIGFERRDRLLRQRDGMGAVAAVERGLAAAGLALRHDDVAAGGFERADRGEADARAHHVDQAGDEQGDRLRHRPCRRAKERKRSGQWPGAAGGGTRPKPWPPLSNR